MRDRIPPSVLRLANTVRGTYWRMTKPERFGVKGLVLHPEHEEMMVLIRNSYGDTETYTLPGGGYNPKRRTAEQAIRDEVYEEVGLKLGRGVVLLAETQSQLEGKTDNISILAGTAESDRFQTSSEVAEALWVPTDFSSLGPEAAISRFATAAVTAYHEQ